MSSLKNISYDERYGKERAILIREKMSKSNIGKHKNSNTKKIDNNFIINTFKERFIKYGGFTKCEWTKYMIDICTIQTVEKKFGSMIKFGEICNIKWKEPAPMSVEQRKNISIYMKNNNPMRNKESRDKVSEHCKGIKKPYVGIRVKELRTGKTVEEIYGEEKGKECRKKISLSRTIDKDLIINTTKERFAKYGGCNKWAWDKYMKDICTSETVANKFGGMDKLAEICNIEWKKPQWKRTEEFREKIKLAKAPNKDLIINTFKERFNKYGGCTKCEWDIHMVDICSRQTAAKHFDGLDGLAKICNIKWKAPTFKRNQDEWMVGKNEKNILNTIEQRNNIELERQFKVGRYYIDGKDNKNNVAYEVDEPYHFCKTQQEYDRKREEKIYNMTGCKFVRINEKIFLKGGVNGKEN